MVLLAFGNKLRNQNDQDNGMGKMKQLYRFVLAQLIAGGILFMVCLLPFQASEIGFKIIWGCWSFMFLMCLYSISFPTKGRVLIKWLLWGNMLFAFITLSFFPNSPTIVHILSIAGLCSNTAGIGTAFIWRRCRCPS